MEFVLEFLISNISIFFWKKKP